MNRKMKILMQPHMIKFHILKKTSLVSYCPQQVSEFDDALFYDFKRADFEVRPLENEEYLDLFKVSQECENSHICNHCWDVDHWNLYGCPVSGTNNYFSEDEIAGFESLGQPNNLGVYAENPRSNLQPCFPMNDSEFFQIMEHTFDDKST